MAQEASLVPVLLLVRQVLQSNTNQWYEYVTTAKSKTNLRVDTDELSALVAVVGEHIFVALDAVRVVVPQHVAVPGQGVVAVVAEHLLLNPRVAVLVQTETKQTKLTLYSTFYDKDYHSAV